MVNFFNEERMEALAFVLYEKASRGDLGAMKFIFQYVMGKPPEAVDPDRLDIDEWRKMQERARPAEENSGVIKSFPVEKMCELARIAWPCTFETNYGMPFGAGLKALDERDARLAGEGKRPSPNGVNSQSQGVAPMTNGSNGTLPEWWDQATDEVLAESRMQAPDRDRRRAKRAKKRRQHAGHR
jgi:hypothetical protein